jgi:hypothetical protein
MHPCPLRGSPQPRSHPSHLPTAGWTFSAAAHARPFRNVARAHRSSYIGVLFCGPAVFANELRKLCAQVMGGRARARCVLLLEGPGCWARAWGRCHAQGHGAQRPGARAPRRRDTTGGGEGAGCGALPRAPPVIPGRVPRLIRGRKKKLKPYRRNNLP